MRSPVSSPTDASLAAPPKAVPFGVKVFSSPSPDARAPAASIRSPIVPAPPSPRPVPASAPPAPPTLADNAPETHAKSGPGNSGSAAQCNRAATPPLLPLPSVAPAETPPPTAARPEPNHATTPPQPELTTPNAGFGPVTSLPDVLLIPLMPDSTPVAPHASDLPPSKSSTPPPPPGNISNVAAQPFRL